MEQGYPDFEVFTWYGMFGPAGLPRDVVNKLNAAVVSAVAGKDLRDRYIALGAEPETSTPEAFAALIRNDIPAWAKVVKAAGAKAE
mgnify:CR=1 FL=1